LSSWRPTCTRRGARPARAPAPAPPGTGSAARRGAGHQGERRPHAGAPPVLPVPDAAGPEVHPHGCAAAAAPPPLQAAGGRAARAKRGAPGRRSQGVPPGPEAQEHPGQLGLQAQDLRLWPGAAVLQRHADHHLLDRLRRHAVRGRPRPAPRAGARARSTSDGGARARAPGGTAPRSCAGPSSQSTRRRSTSGPLAASSPRSCWASRCSRGATWSTSWS